MDGLITMMIAPVVMKDQTNKEDKKDLREININIKFSIANWCL